jgi:hypothetical protein
MVQKYRKMKSQQCMLELSKLFLNEMKAFFRFTEKRETRKVFEYTRLSVSKFYVA